MSFYPKHTFFILTAFKTIPNTNPKFFNSLFGIRSPYSSNILRAYTGQKMKIITLSRPRGVPPHLVIELQRGQVGRRRLRLAARLVPQFLGRGCNLKNTKKRQCDVTRTFENRPAKKRRPDSFMNRRCSGTGSRGGRRATSERTLAEFMHECVFSASVFIGGFACMKINR